MHRWASSRVAVIALLAAAFALSSCAHPDAPAASPEPAKRPSPVSSVLSRTFGPVSTTRGERRLIVSTPAKGEGYVSATWGQVSHPFLFPLGGPRFWLYYTVLGDKIAGAQASSSADWPAFTEDGGETWRFGDPFVWVDGPPPHLTQTRKGEAAVHHLGYGWGTTILSNGVLIGYHRDTESGSTNWRPTQAIWSRDGTHMHGPFTATFRANERFGNLYLSPRAIELPDGTILVLGYGRFRDREIGKWWTAVLMASVDGGRTYDLRSIIAEPKDSWGDEGATESDMVMLPDGEIVCVIRTGAQGGVGLSHPMIMARSRDQGMTWTRTKMSFGGVDPQLCLMRDGTLVLGHGRPGSYLVFSRDGGRSWGSRIALGKSGVQTTGYTDVEEISPGRLLVIYDMQNVVDTGLDGVRQRINGVYAEHIDVRPR